MRRRRNGSCFLNLDYDLEVINSSFYTHKFLSGRHIALEAA
jgi:hypothetical protein